MQEIQVISCIFLVEATGFEGVYRLLKAFIYKGCSVFIPIIPQKLLYFPECHQCLY